MARCLLWVVFSVFAIGQPPDVVSFGFPDGIYLNHLGEDLFGDLEPLPLSSFSPLDVAFGDLNNDTCVDMIVAGDYLNEVLFGDCFQSFVNTEQVLGSSDPGSGAKLLDIGDLDNDGDLDVFFTRNESPTSRIEIWFNDGLGHFTPSEQDFYFRSHNSSVAMGDLDNDGDLDVVTSRRVWINYEDGFLVAGQPFHSFFPDTTIVGTSRVEVGDIDQDSDLDIIALGQGGVVVFRNRGDGSFIFYQRVGPQSSGPDMDLSVGDINGDGQLDIVAVSHEIFVYLNSENGLFVKTPQQLPYRGDHVDLADLDLDSDLDLLVGAYSNNSRIFHNRGDGMFDLAQVLPDENHNLKAARIRNCFFSSEIPFLIAGWPSTSILRILAGLESLCPNPKRFNPGSWGAND